MIKLFFLLFLPLWLYGANLKELLGALGQNDLLEAKAYSVESKQSELKSKKSSFFPTIDLGASYDNTNKVSPFQFKDRYSAYARLELDIYDGGLKYAQMSGAKNELSATKHSKEAFAKSLELDVVKNYYECLSLTSDIEAALDSKKAIKEELLRVEKFVEAGLLAKDEADRLRSSYNSVEYELEGLNVALVSSKKNLELKLDITIDSLEGSSFKKEFLGEIDELSDIKALNFTKASLLDNSRVLRSLYYPTIKLRDTYSYFWYENADTSSMPQGLSSLNDSFKIKEQNVLMLSANIRVFDFSSAKEQSDALRLNSISLAKEIEYKTKEQKMMQDIALLEIQASDKKLKSAKSALVYAKSVYESISKKYQASLVDYVTFLDALKSKTKATSTYKRALNELEVAYASYYYFSGKNLEEFLSE